MKLTSIVCAMAAAVAGTCSVAMAETMYDWTTSGSYKLGESKTVKIPESGELYYSLSGIKAGNAYTFIVNGSGADVEVVYTYKDDGDLWDSTLASSTPDEKTADQERCIVTSDDWISENIVKDPDYEYESGEWEEMKVSPKGYYLHVRGDEDASVSITSVSGAQEEGIPLGDASNPKAISPTAVPTTYTAYYVDQEYYFTMDAKVGAYLLSTSVGTEEYPVRIAMGSGTATYLTNDVSAVVAEAGNTAYLLTVTKAGKVTFCVYGAGSKFGLTYQYAAEGVLGKLTVNTKGTDGTWYIKGVTGTKYESGTTIGILGEQTVCFEKVTGFSTPADLTAKPTAEQPDVVLTGVYNDSYDPKDDVVSGASKLSITKNTATAARTLFAEDSLDHFSFSAKDGYYYDFNLVDVEGQAVMTVFAKGGDGTILAGPTSNIVAQAFAKGDYIVRVSHGGVDGDAQYKLSYSSANVGTVSFSKTSASAKKSSGKIQLSVARSSNEGKVRVRYGTVNGTAQPGVDYVAQEGELVWEDGDKKAKTITIKLIPEALAEEKIEREFTVQLKAIESDELGDDEYPATIATGKDVATVKVTEAKGKAASAVKAATTKTEDVPLETGTFQGVVVEDGSALTNGFPAIASVTFTAKDSTKKALSAKVSLGGKSYTFSADTWDSDETSADTAVAILTQSQKVNKITYTNTLRIEVVRGETSAAGDWKDALAKVELEMNVPDSNGKGVQEGIVYVGELYRNNAKIQDYLYAVTNGVGYYTVALSPAGVQPGDGIPAGNGYLTVTLDNKGKAKIAGLLADGTTKPSYSSIVAVKDDGDTLLVPVFVSKSPYCFGGTLKFVRGETGRFVVDSSEPLYWNNDNALLTYDGEEGWRIALDPVGGYYNTVDNLQAHYLTYDLSVSTIATSEFLAEGLASGYSYVTAAQPDGLAVSLVGNTLSTDKKSLVKDGKLVDFDESVNPCNVQVKYTRATGVVSGTFSAWSVNSDGSAQKEITGLKHYGVLLFSRAANSPIDESILTAGFFTQSAKMTYYDAKNKKKTRTYTASNPFNILAIDQGDPDWYESDWGDRPEE